MAGVSAVFWLRASQLTAEPVCTRPPRDCKRPLVGQRRSADGYSATEVVDDKDMYAEAGHLLRHCLSWREKLLSGYLALIAALALAFVNAPRAVQPLY